MKICIQYVKHWSEMLVNQYSIHCILTSSHEEMVWVEEFETEQNDDTLHWEGTAIHEVPVK